MQKKESPQGLSFFAVSVGDGVPTSRQRGNAALQGPLCEGAVGAADWGREKNA